MAENVDYVFVDEVNSGTDMEVHMDGDRFYVVDADGKLVDAQIVDTNDENGYYIEEDEEEANEQAEEVIQETDEQEEGLEYETYVPDGIEVVETTDPACGDMKFVMVNQQEVLVVRKNNLVRSAQQRKIPLMHQENRVMKKRRVTPQSVKKGPKLIQDFLLPHLDNETFGHLLRWIDREEGKFAMSWSHKNGADWKSDDCAVFREWDRIKERDTRDDPKYWMEAKQRFRAALAKVSLPCTSDREDLKSSRLFQIKWTRETRSSILDQIYTSSKYFELPPRLSYGRCETENAISQAKYYIDSDYTQEVVVGEDTMSADDRDDREETHLELIDDGSRTEFIVEEIVE